MEIIKFWRFVVLALPFVLAIFAFTMQDISLAGFLGGFTAHLTDPALVLASVVVGIVFRNAPLLLFAGAVAIGVGIGLAIWGYQASLDGAPDVRIYSMTVRSLAAAYVAIGTSAVARAINP